MPSRSARIGTVVLLPLLAIAAWAFSDWVWPQGQPFSDSWTTPPPGERVDVGGFRLHLHCQGEAQPGVPVVLLEAGGGDFSQAWLQVQGALASETLVCAYDRAGYGWSDPGPRLRTARRMAAELHTLLKNAGVPPPYVLAAHSFGGFPARRFAMDYPQETAGLVLVDATDESLPFFTPVTAMLAVGLRIEAVRSGIDRQPAQLAAQPHGRAAAAFSAELIALPVTIRQVRTRPGELGDLPLVVIAADFEPETDRVTMSQRDVMTQWSRNSRFVFVESGHALHHERPEVVVDAIRSLLEPFRQPLAVQE